MPDDPYETLDPVLLPWAERQGMRLITRFRDGPARMFLVFDRYGQEKVQIWISIPGPGGQIEVEMAELETGNSKSRGRLLMRKGGLPRLAAILDELRTTALAWAGPGAFV